MPPEFAAGIERVLSEGQAVLPLVSEWLVAQLEGGADYQFPGPRSSYHDREYAQVLEAAHDPRNIHITSGGAIEVVVFHDDELEGMNGPTVFLEGQHVSLEQALTEHRIRKLGDHYYLSGEFRDPVHVRTPYPTHRPISLWTGQRGPTAQIHVQVSDIPTLEDLQRAALSRYGQAVGWIRSMDYIHSISANNYWQYLQMYRAGMQKVLDTLPPDAEPPVAA